MTDEEYERREAVRFRLFAVCYVVLNAWLLWELTTALLTLV